MWIRSAEESVKTEDGAATRSVVEGERSESLTLSGSSVSQCCGEIV